MHVCVSPKESHTYLHLRTHTRLHLKCVIKSSFIQS